MKNLLNMAVVLMLAAACTRQTDNENVSDKWNGYSRFLKMGEQVHTLWAGKHHNIGTVTYGIDDDANFYVKYECLASGWKISETHMFAGDKRDMPLNRPGRPRIGRFPWSAYHQPKVTSYTYRVPLTSLPPSEEPGFVVAAHCVVHHNGNYKCGNSESAWAEGDFTFTDKGWGWYDVFYYNTEADTFNVLYGLTCTRDSLKLYHIDITHGTSDLTFSEYVGNSGGTYDAAAYDHESGYLFFIKVNEGELWANQLQDDTASFFSGPISGEVHSATFADGVYYYVDAVNNAIHAITFNENFEILNDIILDTIPLPVTINDIAMAPSGNTLFLLGRDLEGNMQLLSWGCTDHSFSIGSLDIGESAQIAFASNGRLYAIAPLLDEGDVFFVYDIVIDSNTLTLVEDEIIYIEDPFTDLSSGPVN